MSYHFILFFVLVPQGVQKNSVPPTNVVGDPCFIGFHSVKKLSKLSPKTPAIVTSSTEQQSFLTVVNQFTPTGRCMWDVCLSGSI